jgi:hypothetical protein
MCHLIVSWLTAEPLGQLAAPAQQDLAAVPIPLPSGSIAEAGHLLCFALANQGRGVGTVHVIAGIVGLRLAKAATFCFWLSGHVVARRVSVADGYRLLPVRMFLPADPATTRPDAP